MVKPTMFQRKTTDIDISAGYINFLQLNKAQRTYQGIHNKLDSGSELEMLKGDEFHLIEI